jgi:hypothetical protein
LSDRRFYEQPGSAERRHAPAAARNVVAITAVLADWLPAAGRVLELASGTGEHVVAFARAFLHLEWQPSDVHPQALASIAAWVAGAESENIAPPLVLDASRAEWPAMRADAILAINLVHISPWQSSLGLLDGAGRLLAPGAPLILYGPWIERGIAPAPSNIAFDEDLRSRDPQWGLREVEAFAAEAERRGLDLVERRVMPANNLMLLFRRRG